MERNCGTTKLFGSSVWRSYVSSGEANGKEKANMRWNIRNQPLGDREHIARQERDPQHEL